MSNFKTDFLRDQYSQLFLNGHLFKTDTLCWSRPLFSHFTAIKTPWKTDTFRRRTTETLKPSSDTYEVMLLVKNTSKRNVGAEIDSKLRITEALFLLDN